MRLAPPVAGRARVREHVEEHARGDGDHQDDHGDARRHEASTPSPALRVKGILAFRRCGA
jgi:hypothetical protein